MVGRTLDRYQLLEQVGQGGMAVVYRALDVPLGREVAVKILHPHLSDQPESRARLEREAQAVARLRHPNILEIFSYSGLSSKETYLVTEFIHGPTLRNFLNRHPLLFPEQGAMICAELCSALSCAHALGMIHRDIKPENVMIREDGTVVLCDFGIAQVIDKERMTATGQLLGSPAYMAPEHIDGRPLDVRTDIFSLGVVLYQLVTGELPFRGRNPHETLKRISDGNYRPPQELSELTSTRLAKIIDKAMATEPKGRYGQVEELRQDLLAELKEVGITDPRAELRAFFAEPERWEEEFGGRLKAALIERGRKQQEEGRLALALSTFGRAQVLCPDDPLVASLIRKAARHGRGKKVMALGIYAFGAILLVSSGVALLRRGQGQTKAPVQRQAEPSDLAQGPGPTEPDQARPSESAEPSPKQPEPQEVAAALQPPTAKVVPQRVRPRRDPVQHQPQESKRRVVHLAPWPKAVRVTLNGELLGDYGTDVRSVELRDGENELLFENPACYSERVRIPSGANPSEVRLRLRWKPALLQVKAKEEGDVLLDGRIGRVGQVLALPIRSEDGRATVEVRVSIPGWKTKVHSVEVRANQLTTLEVTPD